MPENDAATAERQATAIAPLLSVRGGAQAIEFYKAALGAVEHSRVEDPDGAVVARLSVGGAEFWLADEAPEHGNFSPAALGGSTARIVLTVDDPDAVFAKALAAGATEIYAVSDQPYGWRLGRFSDPFGHHWEVGQPLH
jgi:PhnB protein